MYLGGSGAIKRALRELRPSRVCDLCQGPAMELAAAGVVVMSGLAKGVDTAALTSAVDNGGKVIGVIGTPLDKAYPAENADLHETIWRHHLLLSPFAAGERVYRGNFPKRNRVMAALSDATVIVEAGEKSGTLHQAAECQRLGRWLFIMKTVAEDQTLKWPASFLRQSKVAVLEKTEDILKAIVEGASAPNWTVEITRLPLPAAPIDRDRPAGVTLTPPQQFPTLHRSFVASSACAAMGR